MTTTDRDVLASLGQMLCGRIGERRYNLWFRHKTKFTWDNDLLVVGVPNLFYQDWLQKTFTDDVRAAAATALARPMRVEFAIDPELFQAARRGEELPEEVLAFAEPTPRDAKAAGSQLFETDADSPPPSPSAPVQRGRARTRRWRQLGDLVIGPCNRVALASAASVVEAPGQEANPLVVHGPVGTGKSHLLEGVYCGLRKGFPDWRVCFITAEDFTNRFVQAMRLSKLPAFRKHFRECDALLLDDLHFLVSKPATQEEFLHTFDTLATEGRQLVVTCDCHPRLEERFMPELADRLVGGAVWGLQTPDQDTRLGILRAKVAQAGHRGIPDEALNLLAAQLRGNGRELEGALNSVLHYAKVAGRRIDAALVQDVLGDLLRHNVRTVQLADVEQAVSKVLHLENGALQARQRTWAISHPRMLAMYLARKHTGAAFAEIGQRFGGRNHSTAVAAEKKVRLWLEKDETMTLADRKLRVRDTVERIERELDR